VNLATLFGLQLIGNIVNDLTKKGPHGGILCVFASDLPVQVEPVLQEDLHEDVIGVELGGQDLIRCWVAQLPQGLLDVWCSFARLLRFKLNGGFDNFFYLQFFSLQGLLEEVDLKVVLVEAAVSHMLENLREKALHRALGAKLFRGLMGRLSA
jgi:hypothetical protein